MREANSLGSSLYAQQSVMMNEEDTSDSVEIRLEPVQQQQQLQSKALTCVKCFGPRENQNPKYCSQCKSLAVKICVRKSCQFPYFEHEVQKHFSNAQTLICVKCEKKMEREKQRQSKMRELSIQNNHRHFNSTPQMPDEVKRALHQQTLEESFSVLSTKNTNASSLAEAKKKNAVPGTDSKDLNTIPNDELPFSPPPHQAEGEEEEEGEEEGEEPSTTMPPPPPPPSAAATNLAQQIDASAVQKVQPVRKRPVRKGDEGEGSSSAKKKKSSKKAAEKEPEECTSMIDYRPKSPPPSPACTLEELTLNFVKAYWKYKKQASGVLISAPPSDKTQLSINFSASF